MRGEQPFGRLAQDHEIDVAGARVGKRRASVRIRLDRAHPGEQTELPAHLQMRRDLGAVGIAHVGQAHGAEQDGIRRFGFPEVLFGQGGAGVTVVGSAAR